MTDEVLNGLFQRAHKAVEVGRDIKQKASEAMTACTTLLQRMRTQHTTLQQIKKLLADHIADTRDMTQRIASMERLAAEVSNSHREEMEALEEYQQALAQIQSCKLHPSLRAYVPTDIPPDSLTYTLADWANLQELARIEEDVILELRQLEQLRNWLNTTIERVNTQFESISKMAYKALDAVQDHAMPDEEQIIKELTDYMRVIDGNLLDMMQHFDKLSFAIRSPQQVLQASVLVFKQINSELSDRLARVQESQQRIEQIKTDIIKRAENYDALLQQLKIAVQQVSEFGQECTAILREMKDVENDFMDYKDGSLFGHLKESADAWKKFVIAYQEMLYELARRRRVAMQTQQLVTAIQLELDNMHMRELKQRKQFEEQFMQYFPQSWPLRTVLMEPPPTYKIVSESASSVLPDVGEQYSQRPLASEIEQALQAINDFSSSLTQSQDPLVTDSPTTATHSADSPEAVEASVVRSSSIYHTAMQDISRSSNASVQMPLGK